MTDRKTQHQLRARLVREGTRTLAVSALTDYRAASYASALKTEQDRVRRDVRAAQDAAADELFGVAPVRTAEPASTTVAELDALVASLHAEAIPGTFPEDAVPYHPRTKQDLLARLNARHKN